MVNWEEIKQEWESNEVTFKELAEKYGVKDSTIRSRKNREKWQRNDAMQRATKKSSVATKKNDDAAAKKKKVSSTGRKRRSGNPNPTPKFAKRNRAAVTHGLFANYINEEQQAIIDQMQTLTLADQIWAQIEIKFSAIIRMQKIMWVEGEFDHLDKMSGYTDGMESSGKTYAVVYAHERYESYIKAQARAMAEYRNLVKQYIELTDEFDERRLKLEAMQTGIDKTRAEIDKLTDNGDEGPIEIMITRKGDR